MRAYEFRPGEVFDVSIRVTIVDLDSIVMMQEQFMSYTDDTV